MKAHRLDRRSILTHWSTDLVLAVAITLALNIAIFAPGVRETVLRVPLGIVFAFCVPGYVLIAALYPERYEPSTQTEQTDNTSSEAVMGSTLTVVERCLLAVACSVVVVPLIGYLLDATQWGVHLTPFVLAASGFTLLTALVAGVRRRRLPAQKRFRLYVPDWLGTARSKRFDSGNAPTTALNILLIASLIFFAASIGYAATGPTDGEQYSEITLLTADGETFVSDSVSQQLGDGILQDIGVGVSNHEGQTLTYTVVVIQQEISNDGDEIVVDDQTELDRFEMTIDDTETAVESYTISPPESTDETRLVWLLYPEDAPGSPSVENAPYHVHLWLSEQPESETPLSADPEPRLNVDHTNSGTPATTTQ